MSRRQNSGTALIYMICIMSALVGFCSLSVDLARVQLAKTQAFRTADAASRYAVQGLVDSSYQARAMSIASQNSADGSPVTLAYSDVVAGVWDSTYRTFTPGGYTPNAVKVFVKRTSANGNAVPLVFAKILGVPTCDINATSVTTIVYPSAITYTAPAQGNPWLAGMPAGTNGNWYDVAPANSPTIAPVTLTPSSKLQFNFSGTASNYPGTNPYTADGNTSWIINNYAGSEHGIANLSAPITAVVGVFLDDNQPDSTAAPASLDFSTAQSRDFSSLSPQVKQPFFIGDGLRADGVTAQDFVVPAGATRLYLGIMDGQQWSDNSGGYSCTVTRLPIITTVK